MAELEILNMAPGELNPEEFRGAGIDLPVKGDRQDHFALTIAGWLVHGAGDRLDVRVLSQKREIASWPVNRPRPDVAAVIEGATSHCGFMGIISTTILPQLFELEVYVLSQNSRSLLGTIYGRRSPFTVSTNDDEIRPALVTTLGRCGSTLLMLLLDQHPQLIVHPPLPFETHIVSYWTSVVAGLSSPPSYLRALVGENTTRFWWTGEEPFASETYVNQDPVAHWLGGNSIENLAAFARRQILGFYDGSASLQSKSGPGLRYFVEKQLPYPHERNLLVELFPKAVQIFLVRDFRDMVASILAFNKKRNQKGFGADLFQGEAYIVELRESIELLWQAWQSAGERALLVRYEDLVLRPKPTLTRILNFLELPASEELVEGLIEKAERVEPAAQQQHRTSRDSAASIGRWKKDLPAEIRDSCNREFAQVLTAFGYTV